MKYIFVFILCLFVYNLDAQTIKVLDKKTKDPIPGVAVYNSLETKTAISDLDGNVDLSIFLDHQSVTFKHISYVKIVYIKSNIPKEVFLSENSQGLDQVVISASKFEQKKRDIPQKIKSIKASDISFSNPQTSADLLLNSGEVFVQKSQLGGGSPIVRGFSTNRVSLLIDGIRFNNAIFRTGNVQNVISIDPFSIQNTEVTLGAGSVIYGSDAIGGVINYYSLTPKLSTSNDLNFEGNASVRYASASNENTGHIDFNLGYKKWGFLTSVSYTDFDDLTAGRNGPDDFLRPDFVQTTNGQDVVLSNTNPREQVSSGYNQINFLQKARYKASHELYLDFGLHYSTTSDYDRFDRLTRRNDDGQLRSAEWFFGPQRWFLANAKVTKLSTESKFYDNVKFSVAYQNSQESRNDRNFNSVNRRTREENVDAISLNIDFENAISSKSKLFYGAEYIYNLVGSEARQTNIETNQSNAISTRYPDGSTWQSIAGYISYKYKPNKQVSFQSGLRYNQVLIRANLSGNNEFFNFPFENVNLSNGALTGSAGVSWSPNNVVNWKINASTAFRAPNIDDIGKVFDSEPGAVVVPNGDLEPEYAYNGELGVSLNFEKKLIVDLSAYYTFLDNALIRRSFSLNGETQVVFDEELSDVLAIQNASKSDIYGLEIGVEIPITQNLKLRSQYNIIRGEEEDENGAEVPVRHVTPDFGNTHFVWEKNKFKFDIYADYSGALAFEEISPTLVSSDFLFATDAEGNPFSPSWYTLNLRTEYNLNQQVSLTGAVENITDQLYRTYSSGISAPGLNFILALNYKL